MSDPPLTERRRNGGASQPGRSASEPREEVIFVYTGQPIEEIPRKFTQLVVDPSVRSIQANVFEHYRQLRSITIPPAVEVIGLEAFMGCASLTDVHLHRGLKSIGAAAFCVCTSLTNVRLPEGLKFIGEDAFRNCNSLLEVNLPYGITEIEDYTFDFCKSLRTVSIPITVETIGWRAFANCISLVDVSLPTHLKLIDSCAFAQCKALSSVGLPSSLELVGEGAFSGCKSLLSVEFPPSSSNIRFVWNCFDGAESLVNVSISRSTSGLALFECPIPEDKRDCLTTRFASHPVHSLCYESSTATRDQMMRVLHGLSDNLLDDSMMKDAFDMTPFHILATSASLNTDILECLLERYPIDILGYKDLYGNTMMDFLLKHTSPRAVPLLQMVLKRAVIDVVSTWHPLPALVESIPLNSDMDRRRQSVKDFFGQVGYCHRIEITSVMELAVWNTKMRSIQELESDNEHDAIGRRESCRYQSGAGIVIENVIGYLWNGESTYDTALSLFPLIASSTSIENRHENM